MKLTLSKNILLACAKHSFRGYNPWGQSRGVWKNEWKSTRKEHEIFWEAMRDTDWKRWRKEKSERWHKQTWGKTEMESSWRWTTASVWLWAFASALESLCHPQWHVVSRPLPHHIIVLCALMWSVHMYSTLCWLYKTHRPQLFLLVSMCVIESNLTSFVSSFHWK